MASGVCLVEGEESEIRLDDGVARLHATGVQQHAVRRGELVPRTEAVRQRHERIRGWHSRRDRLPEVPLRAATVAAVHERDAESQVRLRVPGILPQDVFESGISRSGATSPDVTSDIRAATAGDPWDRAAVPMSPHAPA